MLKMWRREAMLARRHFLDVLARDDYLATLPEDPLISGAIHGARYS
jgi:hypothetical protein